jgi:integrase
MALKVKSFIAKNGERFTQIYDTDLPGFPLFYPTLYCALELTSNIKHKTQKTRMYVIKKILEWSRSMQIALDTRFENLRFLTKAECRLLVNFLILKKNSKEGDTICNSKANDAILVAAKYLPWLAYTVCGTHVSESTKDSISLMETEILRQKRKKGSSAAKSRKIIAKKIDEIVEAELKRIFSNLLLIKKKSIISETYIRNIICLEILYETGIRLGELLSLQLSSFDNGTGGNEPSLSVVRGHDNPNDDRVDQPTPKTLERTIAISEDLSKKITYYLDTIRQHIPNVGFDSEDFIFVNHIRGPRQGKAVQYSSFENAIARIRTKNITLKGLHPHLLRHHWNYLFSIEAELLGYSEEKERAIREYYMGWVDNSAQSARYNLRKIQEDAMKIGRRIANDTKR